MEGFITFLLFFALFLWVMKRVFPLLLAWVIKRKLQKGGQTAEDLPARAVSVSGAPGLVAVSPSRHGKRRRKRGKW